MPQNPSDAIKPITDIGKNAYHALTSAFHSDPDEDSEAEKKRKAADRGGADPGMVSEANKSFAADPSHRTPAGGGPLDKVEDKFKDAKPLKPMQPIKPQGFMAKAMNKKPAPAAAPAPNAARNRYGSTVRRGGK